MKNNYYEHIINKLNYYIQLGILTEKLNNNLQECILLLDDNTLTDIEQEKVLLEINKYENEIKLQLSKLVLRYESFINTTKMLPEDKVVLERYIKYLNDDKISLDQKIAFLQKADKLKKNIQKNNEHLYFIKRCAWFIENNNIDKDTKLTLEEYMTKILNKNISTEIKDGLIKHCEVIIEAINWRITVDRLREYMKIAGLSENDLTESEALATLLETSLIDYNSKREIMKQAMIKIEYYEKAYPEYIKNKKHSK